MAVGMDSLGRIYRLPGEEPMSSIETLYLVGSLAAFLLFAVTLAWVSRRS